MKKQGELEHKLALLKDEIYTAKSKLGMIGWSFIFPNMSDETAKHGERVAMLRFLGAKKGTDEDTIGHAERRAKLQAEEDEYQKKIKKLEDLKQECLEACLAVCEALAKKFHV